MDERGLFTMALGLTPPWEVVDIDFDAERHRLDLYLDFPRREPVCVPAMRGGLRGSRYEREELATSELFSARGVSSRTPTPDQMP